jgi:hypothetical protein
MKRPTFQERALKKDLANRLIEAVEMLDNYGNMASVVVYMRNTMKEVAQELIDNRF